MALGPIMIDVEGPELDSGDRELLRHPTVGGVILFSRNYVDRDQLARLVADVHGLREPRLLVAVDQEGGRVQRFREGFTNLPAPARYGAVFDEDPGKGLELARAGGWLMAVELRSIGIDFSIAPVLDLATGRSAVIGERAFHRDPDVVASLANAFVRGMRSAGMSAVGKHFPGHGSVTGDSHEMLPEDTRDLETLRLEDMLPFERMIGHGLPAVMPAHVLFPAVDYRPPGFSRRWIHGVLRGELGFSGAVFSDDLSMAGAESAGSAPRRARAALDAGCDMGLICNDRTAAVSAIDALEVRADSVRSARLARMHGRTVPDASIEGALHARAREMVAALDREPELGLGDDELL